jgi:hypothetical protein
MSLTQFGSVISFAIKLESSLSEFYEKASEGGGVQTDELTRRAKACVTRKRKLEQSRRLNVTEIVLEPIEGLSEADYQLDWTMITPQAIDLIEETVIRFYMDAAPKINILESRRIFERCQKEHNSLIKLVGPKKG